MYPFDVSDFVGFGPRLRFRDITRKYPRVSVAATDLPVERDKVKQHARIGTAVDDELVDDYIRAAVEDVEYETETALMTQTRILYMDFFPAWEMELRTPPIQAVTSITYLDFQGIQQTLASTAYRVDTTGYPGIITPVYGTVWPVAYPVIDAVQVTFTCGYTAASLVPFNAKRAIYLRVSTMYWNREDGPEEDESFQRCCDKLRWRKVC